MPKKFVSQNVSINSEVILEFEDTFTALNKNKDSYEIQMRDSTKSVEYRAVARDRFLKCESFMYGIEYMVEKLGIKLEEDGEV